MRSEDPGGERDDISKAVIVYTNCVEHVLSTLHATDTRLRIKYVYVARGRGLAVAGWGRQILHFRLVRRVLRKG